MPNKNYLKGRRREWKIKRELEKEGNIVLRCAGSHGFCDLVAIDKSSNMIKFIQCKPKNFSKNKKEELVKEYDWVYDIWSCRFDVM